VREVLFAENLKTGPGMGKQEELVAITSRWVSSGVTIGRINSTAWGDWKNLAIITSLLNNIMYNRRRRWRGVGDQGSF
jgi:hypothetical protein